MKVKAKPRFSYYRLCTFEEGLSYDDFRALQRGESVDVSKEFFEGNQHILEVAPPEKKVKEVKHGD